METHCGEWVNLFPPLCLFVYFAWVITPSISNHW